MTSLTALQLAHGTDFVIDSLSVMVGHRCYKRQLADEV
jgi:hypothetical protein